MSTEREDALVIDILGWVYNFKTKTVPLFTKLSQCDIMFYRIREVAIMKKKNVLKWEKKICKRNRNKSEQKL